MSDNKKNLLEKITPARLARMKFEAFINTPEGDEEGTITYDEMLALHPDVVALNQETEELNQQTEELNQQATAVQDTQLKPKKEIGNHYLKVLMSNLMVKTGNK